MNNLNISGIVLGGFPFGEANKIITVFSDKLGLIKTVANGIRKTKSKFGSTLELMNKVHLSLGKSKTSDLFNIKEFKLIKSNHKIRENYNLINYLFYLVEFLNKVIGVGVEHILIYNQLLEYIDLLEIKSKNYYELTRGFQIKVLNNLGYLPELLKCCNCQNNLLEKEVYISLNSGFFLCDNCRKSTSDYYDAISFLICKILNNMILDSLEISSRIILNDTIKKEINRFFSIVITKIIGKKLTTEKNLFFEY